MPEPSTVASSGLFARDAARTAVPLAGVSIEARISALSARVVVAQRYVNREATPIEAVYVFPLEEGAAVCGFEAIVGGTLVVGEVREREEAFDAYDEAIDEGHGAFLLDEERPDVFQASIGNLPPGGEVLVRITYVTELSMDEGRLRFAIPTTVSPRYAPAEDRVATGRPDSEALNPPLAWTVPYGLDLTVHIAIPGRITAVESPSHAIAVEHGDEVVVTPASRETALDRDFVLSIAAAGLDVPRAWVERDDEGHETVAVGFVPVLPDATAPADIVFLVDRSGSMGGDSIEEVRNALQLCLRSMTHGCRFNIVGFGSSHEALFPGSRAYDQASLDEAARHVAGLQADLGGTEILPALQFVLEQPSPNGLARQVVVLTDGEVTNTDAVIALAARHARRARIFTFGIGAGASHHLVRGLARAGGGTAEFIHPGERIEAKVVRLFSRLLTPALAGLNVEWTGGQVTQAPSTVPPVFSGHRFLVYGFVTGARPSAVRLSAQGPAGPVAFDVPVADAPVLAGRTLATLAARARIRELEESPEWFENRGSRQRERKAGRVVREIVELSIRYGVVSRETSFVAVERRDTPVQGEVQLRRVPIALTAGWGGVDTRRRTAAHDLMADIAVAHRSAPSTAAPAPFEQLAASPEMYMAFERRAPDREMERRRRQARRPLELDVLVGLQAADGSWDLDRAFADVLRLELSELEAALPDAFGNEAGAAGREAEVRRAWATALALMWLERYAGEARDEWHYLARKGHAWLDRAGVEAPDGARWLNAAHRFLEQHGRGPRWYG